MKVVEEIFEYRIWQQIEIDDMPFGFMKRKGNTDTIFTVRKMQKNFRAKGKKRSIDKLASNFKVQSSMIFNN